MPFSNQAVIGAVMRAAERGAAGVHHDMSRGLNGLATIASVAPWLGLLITVMGIVGSFSVCNGPSPFCLAAVADGLGDALARAALGLVVGILSLYCYRYLSFQLEDLDIEMRNMALELANVLSRARRRPRTNPLISDAEAHPDPVTDQP